MSQLVKSGIYLLTHRLDPSTIANGCDQSNRSIVRLLSEALLGNSPDPLVSFLLSSIFTTIDSHLVATLLWRLLLLSLPNEQEKPFIQ